MTYATSELVQDSAFEALIRRAFALEFGLKIDEAIFSGSGVGQPLGIMNSGALITVAKEGSQNRRHNQPGKHQQDVGSHVGSSPQNSDLGIQPGY